MPVQKRKSRAQTTAASIRNSPVWKFFTVKELTENMRVGSDPDLKEFDDWLLKLGNDSLLIHERPDWIAVRDDCLRVIGKTTAGDMTFDCTPTDSMELCVK